MMSKLRSVLLGLAAVLIFGVFEVHAQLSVVSRSDTPGIRVQIRCPAGSVAISCVCSGPGCTGAFHLNINGRRCRATKTALLEATITATCAVADAADFYLSNTGTCTQSVGDVIVGCNLREGVPSDQVILVLGVCVQICPAENCVVQAVCMIAPVTTTTAATTTADSESGSESGSDSR